MTEKPAHHYSLGYRPDIEGLRAIAVLLVIFAHARVAGLAGGFIGVDVFFVISGYLITGLLLKEITSSQKIGFLSFYSRRLKRLAPALYILVLASTGAIYLLLSPLDQPKHLAAAAPATLWLSNFYFASLDIDYFAEDSDKNVFLHTWSLSVEEQFYLLWPLAIYLVWRYATRRRTDPRSTLTAGIAVICLLSFTLSYVWTYSQPSLAYFMPFTRAWQFAAGALVILLQARPKTEPTHDATHNVNGHTIPLGSIGLLGLALSLVFIGPETAYPGAWSLLPTLSTALLLVAGSAANPVSRLLSCRPLVFIGGISYSWYLWHWPVLILARSLDSQDNIETRGIAVAMSFAMAYLSKKLIEDPIRFNKTLDSRPRLAMYLTVIGAVLVILVPIKVGEGSYKRLMHDDSLGMIYGARKDLPRIYTDGCDDWIHSADLIPCDYGNPSATHVTYLIGDSIAGQWFSAMDNYQDAPGSRLRVFTKSSCPMIDEPHHYAAIGKDFEFCEIWRDRLIAQIEKDRPQRIVFSSASSYNFPDDKWQRGTRKFLDRIKGSTVEIVILAPTPTLKSDPTYCIANQLWRERSLPFQLPGQCTDYQPQASSARVSRLLSEVARDYDKVYFADLNDLVCPAGSCPGTRGDYMVFRDPRHLTDNFVKSIRSEVQAHLTGLSR